MQHDVSVALAFLQLLYPGGPWVLTAIDPEPPNKTNTQTFREDSVGALESWLRRFATHNIYYSVNKLLSDANKKAAREDIDSVCYLHVDVDPRVNVPWEEETVRIRKLFENMPKGIPRPTAAIYSGGGVNALWKLQEPIRVNGNLEIAEQAKRYNIQLEVDLGGDNCHNVDRILRLPGTVNWLNAKKKKKWPDRVVQMTTLLWFEPGSYPIGAFKAAPMLQTAENSSGGFMNPTRVNVTGNIRRLSDVDELGDKVRPNTKALIVQGMDPDDPTKWTSRSELLFHVCCELVRAGISDEVIYSVITDPDFRISASVLDKGSTTERYALRQIERAKEDAIAPELRELNGRYAVVGNIGGKCRVIEEMKDMVGKNSRTRLTDQAFEDFKNYHMNRKVDCGEDNKGNPIRIPLGKWWLEHPSRRQYDRIVFSPKGEHPNCYNLWQGFAYAPKEGKNHELWLEHVRKNICSGNEEHYEYVVSWMARAVQHADSQGEVAIVLRGLEGTGKSVFAHHFGRLFGRHYLPVSDPKHIVGSFNSHLRDCVILFSDEAFFAGDKKHESMIKTLITEESLMIEAKGKDAVIGPNYVHLIMASNSDWVVPASGEARRYCVLDVSDKRMQDAKYFGEIVDALNENNGEGYSNLLYYLMHHDISHFDVRKPPKTKALQDQKQLSFSSEEEWWFRKLQTGQIARGCDSWTSPVLHEKMISEYLNYAQRIGIQRRANATAIGRFLQRACPPGWPRSKQGIYKSQDEYGITTKERAYFYIFPDLAECRKHWDAHFGGPFQWPKDDEENSIVFDESKPSREEVF